MSTPAAPVLRAEVDSTLKYFLIFLLLGFGSGLYFSYLLAVFGSAPSAGALIAAGAMCCAFLLIVVFQSFFIQSLYFNLILLFLETFGVFGYFYRPFSIWYIGAGLLFILCHAWGLNVAKREMNSTLKIHFWRYSSKVLTGLITGISFLGALLYIGVYQTAGGVSYEAYRFSTSGITGIEYVVPNFSLTTKTDTLFAQYAQQALKNDAQYNVLSKTEQDKVAAQAGAALKKQAESLTSLKIASDTSLLDYGYQLLKNFIKKLEDGGLGSLVLAAMIAIIFFSIKGVMFFLRWPLLIAASVLYFLMLSVGIISIQTEQRQKEVAVIH